MSEIQTPVTAEYVLARMEAGRAMFYASLQNLSDAQWQAPITSADWSICDHLAHIAVWMDGIVAMLSGGSRWATMGGGPPEPGGGFDRLNEQLRAPHRDKSAAEIRALVDDVHGRMANLLGRLSAADLQLPYRHYQPTEERTDGDTPVLRWVIADTYGHYEEHRIWVEEALIARGWPVATELETFPTTVRDLRVQVDAEWEMLALALGDLSEADFTTDRGEGWSLGDHLAHIAAWELGISGLLSGAPRWHSMGVDPATLAQPSVDAINAAVRDLYRGKPAADVLALRDEAHQRLLSVIDGLSDADLARHYHDYDPDEERFPTNRPISIWIAQDTYEHYRDHRLWLARVK